METKIRHLGLVVTDLKQALKFYQKFGFTKLTVRGSTERWGKEELKVQKLINSKGEVLELIQGNWKPHIALTVISKGKPMEEIWINHAIKADVLIEYKKVGNLEIIYLKDPFGNFVEVVSEC